MQVIVGISNRHAHLTQEVVDILFGKGYQLTKLKNIKQIGQYSAVETIGLKTEKNTFEKVRVMGPNRNYNQIEISKSDAHYLGIKPPVRESGDVIDSHPITLIGPQGEVTLQEGCIISKRHIHMDEKTAKDYGFQNDEIVQISYSGEKGGIMDNVVVKITSKSFFEIHLDLDDANAFLIKQDDYVRIIRKEEK